MHITALLVITYILSCLRLGVAPWRYWQINAAYFSRELGVFSKLALDRLIPERWHLWQIVDNEQVEPQDFPLFAKPEWGQNAKGVQRIDNVEQLARFRHDHRADSGRRLLQEAAEGRREFEVFVIDIDRHDDRHDLMSVTEAVNARESLPVNSKYNRDTRYLDISADFDADERDRLAGFLREIGRFGIARLSARADSTEALLRGDFRIIEINLYLPMPINLLDSRVGWRQRWRFIRESMWTLALATAAAPRDADPAPIFLDMLRYGHRGFREGGLSARVAAAIGLGRAETPS